MAYRQSIAKLPVILPIPEATLRMIAAKGSYTLDVNPKQALIDNIGIDLFFGGGCLLVGQSATDLDDSIARIESYLPGQPDATYFGPYILMDTGQGWECQWTRCSLPDVQNLRAAFFALYGLGKPDWYGPTAVPD